MAETPPIVTDISGFLISLRTKEDYELVAISRSVSTGKSYSCKDWCKAKDYASWILDVRERAFLSNFFNECYQAEHWWMIPPLSASVVLESYRRWKLRHFTELERECIIVTEDDLMEYLLVFAPNKSTKNDTYYGFKVRDPE